MKLNKNKAIIVGIFLGAVFVMFMYRTIPRTNTSKLTISENNTKKIYTATTTPDGKLYQYVSFSFDGGRSIDVWRKTLDFAKKMDKAGIPIHFTYFINAIYIVPEAHKDIYHPPNNPIGKSLIGYGSNTEEISKRISLINEAYRSGHEIGSHGVGHNPGYNWTKDDWLSELSQFNDILAGARNGVDTTIPLEVPATAIKGFRAPNLVVDVGLTQALDQLGYIYDASRTAKVGSWPGMDGGHAEMSLALIPYAGKKILSMDYNFYLSDSGAKDTLKKSDPNWQKKHDEMLAAYMNYFTTNYNSNRAPVFIGHHFAEWNDGLYSDVLEEAIKGICGKPYVRCATHKETLDYLNLVRFTP